MGYMVETETVRQKLAAFEGFTGPLDKVEAGDFQKLIDHLRFYAWGSDTKQRDGELTADLLNRLSPTEDSSHD